MTGGRSGNGNGLEHLRIPARGVKFCNEDLLPAGFGHSRYHAGVGEFPESDTAEFKAANERVTAAGKLAAVGAAGRAGIARQHGETYIVTALLEFSTQSGILFDSLLFALFAFDPAGFSHILEVWEILGVGFLGSLHPGARESLGI
jgi:hypothetical protein